MKEKISLWTISLIYFNIIILSIIIGSVIGLNQKVNDNMRTNIIANDLQNYSDNLMIDAFKDNLKTLEAMYLRFDVNDFNIGTLTNNLGELYGNYLIINKRMNTFDLNLNMTKEKLNEVINKQNKCIDCHHD